MFAKKVAVFVLSLGLIGTMMMTGCDLADLLDTEDDPTPAEFDTDAEVFTDQFGSSVTFQAFSGSILDAVQIDNTQGHDSDVSLIITIPDEGNQNGNFAGGAFTSTVGRDLSGYDALTLWAKASRNLTLNVAGLGNDNTGNSLYMAQINEVPVTTSWTKIVVPIPLASKLTAEQGLFYFAEGHEDGVGATLWIDDVLFEELGTITNPQPSINTDTLDAEINDVINILGTTVTFSIAGTSQLVYADPGYFSFSSSDENILSVGPDGTITAIGVGSAEITASLGTVAASGIVTVQVGDQLPLPTVAASDPAESASDVVSIYSDSYNSATIDNWSATWDQTIIPTAEEQTIGSNHLVKFTDLYEYAGIDFSSNPVDASGMTRFHVDFWTPLPVADTTEFNVKIVDFGDDGVYGGGDDSEHAVAWTPVADTSFKSQTWVGMDVALGTLSGLTGKSNVTQLVLTGDLETVYIDNIYFYDDGTVVVPGVPAFPAPTPTVDPDSVISLFSDAYVDVPVDTFSTTWDHADLLDTLIAGDHVKKYTTASLVGIEASNPTIDASSMTRVHLDIWTPDVVTAASYRLKLVDWGADGAYSGGDDVEHEITLSATSDPALVSEQWISIDLPLSDFPGLTTRGNMAQFILSGSLGTIYVDNFYFYDDGSVVGPNPEPSTSAPTPTYPSTDVISLFCDEYTDVTVDTWSASWDEANVSAFALDSDNMKMYTSLTFAGIEFTSNVIDAASPGMTHFRFDMWTPDDTSDPVVLKVKLVDFGANGSWDGGGDDVEHELTFTASTDPALTSENWVTFDIPLSDFTNLTTTGALAQLILTSGSSPSIETMFLDNVLFHK